MLGKSVLPRVLVRVTLLLPAHLPVLIGQRVSHSCGCRLVVCGGVCTCRGVLMLAVNVGKVVKKGRPFLTTLPTLTANINTPLHVHTPPHTTNLHPQE